MKYIIVALLFLTIHLQGMDFIGLYCQPTGKKSKVDESLEIWAPSFNHAKKEFDEAVEQKNESTLLHLLNTNEYCQYYAKGNRTLFKKLLYSSALTEKMLEFVAISNEEKPEMLAAAIDKEALETTNFLLHIPKKLNNDSYDPNKPYNNIYPVHRAVVSKTPKKALKILQLLASAKADLMTTSEKGETLLQKASQLGYLEVTEWLVSREQVLTAGFLREAVKEHDTTLVQQALAVTDEKVRERVAHLAYIEHELCDKKSKLAQLKATKAKRCLELIQKGLDSKS